MANLTPDEIPMEGRGSIDNELLRDKFTGRQRLFWNQANQSGRKWERDKLSYKSPELQLDPRVQYRTAGPNAYEDFLKTGIVRGTWGDGDDGHAKLFMSQGAPLWSYGEDALAKGESAYLFATLGEGWGDRDNQLRLSPEEVAQLDSKEFEITKAFTKEEHSEIDLLKKSLKALEKKEMLQLNKITGEYERMHTDENIDYLLKKHERIIDRISSSFQDVKKLVDTKQINSQHPMASWMEMFEGKMSNANGNPRAFTLKQDSELDWTGGIRTRGIDTTNLADSFRYLKPSVSGGYSTTNYTPMYNFLRQLQSLHRTDSSDASFKLINGPNAVFNPFLQSKGWSQGQQETVSFENSSIAGTYKHPSEQLYNEFGEVVNQSSRPFLGSYYDKVNSQISPDLVRLGALDDSSPTWQSGESISKFLTRSLKTDVVHNNGMPFPMLQSNFLTGGRQGAMHTERVPRSVVNSTLKNPDGTLKQFGFAAQSINANSRPMAVFKINPNHPDGFELVHQFNNDPLPDGTLPIPTKAVSQQAIIDSARRFVFEEVPKLGDPNPEGGLNPAAQRRLLDNLDLEKIAAGVPTANLSEAVAQNLGILGKEDQWFNMGGIKDKKSFYGLQNVVTESTRGNPNYGRKGFVNMNLLLAPYRPFVNVAKGLTEEDQFMAMMQKGLSTPRGASNFASHYVNNPAIRSYVNGNMVNSTVNALGKVGAAAAIATAPSMSVDRRDRMAYEWAMNNRGYPDQLELLGLEARAGIENMVNGVSFGIYDHYVHPEWQPPMELLQRGYYSDNGQKVPNWVPNLQSTLLAK